MRVCYLPDYTYTKNPTHIPREAYTWNSVNHKVTCGITVSDADISSKEPDTNTPLCASYSFLFFHSPLMPLSVFTPTKSGLSRDFCHSFNMQDNNVFISDFDVTMFLNELAATTVYTIAM